MPFQRMLALNEMQTASTWIWTQVTNSISYNDKSYAKHTFHVEITHEKCVYLFKTVKLNPLAWKLLVYDRNTWNHKKG